MNLSTVKLNNLPITLILMGTHTSGKRVIGQKVAQDLGWHFDPELGDILRENKNLKNGHEVGYENDWDEKIFIAEEERDRNFHNECRIIETWHIGNLLWAMFRDPCNACSRYLQRTINAVDDEMKKSRVIIIFLSITKETVLRRHQMNKEKREEVNMSDEKIMCNTLHEKLGILELNKILIAMSPQLIVPCTIVINDIDNDESNDIITNVANTIIQNVIGMQTN